MPIVTIAQLKSQLGITLNTDDALLELKIESAQDFVETSLGYKIASRFGGEGQGPVPASLREAVLLLAAHWFENREAAGDSMRAIPFGVDEAIQGYRDWSF